MFDSPGEPPARAGRMRGAFASTREGGSRVSPGQLDHLSQSKDSHRELRSRRQAGQDVTLIHVADRQTCVILRSKRAVPLLFHSGQATSGLTRRSSMCYAKARVRPAPTILGPREGIMAQVLGFIGLGIMGRPMARNLLKAGYPLLVHSRSQGPVQELVGAGAKAANSPKDVASQVEVLITMLPNSPDVDMVALGQSGIIEGARPGLLLLDMSTISPLVSQKVGKALQSKGVRMLDAPVSGGEKGAIEGALSIMVGGEKSDFDAVLPVFQALGKTITHL